MDRPYRSMAELAKLHSDCQLDNQAVVCSLDDTCDLLLAPVPSPGVCSTCGRMYSAPCTKH